MRSGENITQSHKEHKEAQAFLCDLCEIGKKYHTEPQRTHKLFFVISVLLCGFIKISHKAAK
ncbi:MAG: hypothetical protein DRI57_25735 [Deltaproteobacteria bacterium]|nr:MAG: hypothetical protein DRI57_25735 [Deltaproteobacteria bacterium]